MSASTMTANIFSVLSLEEIKPFCSKNVSKTVPKEETTPKAKPVVPYALQSTFPLTMILFSGATNNEYVIGKTKISPEMKLKKSATAQDLNTKINKMGLSFPCLVWGTTIDTPELEKIVDNQYSLPEEYQHLHDLLCDDTIKSMKRQNVLILDFRRPHIKGKEYVYLQNHQQFFFGNTRKAYLDRKSEINGFKKVYDAIRHVVNLVELNKAILECQRYALTGTDNEWVSFREKMINQFKDASSIFEESDAKIFERFPTIEALKKEGEQIKLFKQEVLEMLPKMKLEFERKKLSKELYHVAFPSL